MQTAILFVFTAHSNMMGQDSAAAIILRIGQFLRNVKHSRKQIRGVCFSLAKWRYLWHFRRAITSQKGRLIMRIEKQTLLPKRLRRASFRHAS
jgi:hypothetical protein